MARRCTAVIRADLWALDQAPASLDLHATPCICDTLAALDPTREACDRSRTPSPQRANPIPTQLEITVSSGLDPAEAYGIVPGRSPQNG